MDMETLELLLWLIPVPPLLAFFLIVLFTNRSKWLSHTVAIAAALASFVMSMIVLFEAVQIEHLGAHPIQSAINWLPTGIDSWLQVGVRIDPLSAVTLFFVAWTVLAIFIYSVGYHNYGQPAGSHDLPGLPPHGALTGEHGHQHAVPSVEPLYSRFFAFIALFAFGMYLLVVSDNLLTLFVGWEIMGLCSYLLIGFWFAKPSARAAAIKAFLTTRIGDVFMLLGIVYLYSELGSLRFDVIFDPDNLARLASAGSYIAGFSAAGLIGLLLFIGTIGKSAQWPLHVWLPDAMEGPTPVSAMIHAATMVSAGVYMLIRVFPILTADPISPTLLVISIIGAFTALFAATIAVAQNDIKRVLAYSTISQLGYMVAAVGIGAYVAAAFHLVTHAFFKALLFLGSGSVIHGMEHGVLHTGGGHTEEGDHTVQTGHAGTMHTGTEHSSTDEVGVHVDPQNMLHMGGLRHKMPITFWTFLIGGLALSGFPLVTAGFWSKDEILADAFAHGHLVVFGVLAVAALLTAFYTMRQITLTFLGQPRTEAAEHASETPWTMTLPLAVLAVFAVAFGWLGIPEDFPLIGGLLPNWFHHFVADTITPHPAGIQFNPVPLLTSIVVSLGGLGLGYLVYRGFKVGEIDPLKRSLGGLHTLLENKYYFDEIYDATFVRFSNWLATTFTSEWMDQGVIDGILHGVARFSPNIGSALRAGIDKGINWLGDAVGQGTKQIGLAIRYIQPGLVQQYMFLALLLVALVGAGFFAALELFR